MKLGFAVQVLGQPGLKPNDTRRWQNNPHLSVSLAYLRDILVHLRQIDVHMYRLSSDLAPYVTHPDLPQFHNQIAQCQDELAALGEFVRQDRLRLSFHPGAHAILNAQDPAITAKAIDDLCALASILDHMHLGPEAVIVIHVGGQYGDKPSSMQRFVDRYLVLDEPLQRRLVLENDDRVYTVGDTLAVHRQTGIRVVFDRLHNQCNPTPGLNERDALRLALDTWSEGEKPKIHFSSPRTSMNLSRRGSGADRQYGAREPRLSHHADLIDPFSFVEFLRSAAGDHDFDVMLECKAKDIALLRLRRYLVRLAPDLVASHQIS